MRTSFRRCLGMVIFTVSVLTVMVFAWRGAPLVTRVDSDTGKPGHMNMVLVIVHVHWMCIVALAVAATGLLLWLWPARQRQKP